MINKIVRKSMNKKKGLLFAILVLLFISSLFVGLAHFVYDTMDSSYTQMKTDSNVEDFRIYALPLDEEQFSEVYSEQFIEEFEDEFEVSIETKEVAKYTPSDESRSYLVNKYDQDQEINKIILEEGSFPTKDNQILIQPQALTELNLSVGDSLDIDGTTYTISGTGYLIEFITPSDIMGGQLTPNFDKFMPIVMSEKGFEEIDQDSKEWNFSKIFTGKYDQFDDNIINRLSSLEEMTSYKPLENPVMDDNGLPQYDSNGEMVTEETDRFMYGMDISYNMTISGVEGEIKGSQTSFIFLSTLLSIITIFLATILVNSVFKSQRREMGIMKAEGVSIPKLGFGFAFYMLVLIIIGFLVGAYASTFASKIFRDVYAEMFMLKDYLLSENIIATVATDLLKVGVVMTLAIYFLSIRRNLNTPTLHLIKNISSEKPPKHNVGKLFRKLSFVRKYQLNLILRNFSKTVLLMFAVIISSFLLLLGTLMYDSIHNMMDNMFGKTFTYEYVVNYSKNNIINEGDVANGYISKRLDLISVPREDELEDPLTGEEQVSFEAYDFDNSATVNLTDTNGDKLSNDIDGAIASSGFMKNYNLEVGDTFTVKNPYKANSEVDIKIVSETSDFFLPYVYMPLDVYQETFNIRDDMINAYQSEDKLTDSLKNEIEAVDSGAMIYANQDMEEMLGDNMKMLNVTIVVIAVLAAVIAFVALYSISSVIIESNSKTISVMKVLGYSSKEIRTMTIGMYKWLVIAIYLISIPGLEKIIQEIVNMAMGDADFVLPINLNYTLSLLGLLVIIVVYLIASNLTYRKITQIKLAESLKADE